MFTSKIYSIGLTIACFAMVAGVTVAQELIVNGDFETVTEGTFDSWNYSPETAGSIAPIPIDGSYSANIAMGQGAIWQQVSETGLSDFSWELDFATLSLYTGSRSLHILTHKTEPDSSNLSTGNVDSIRVVPSGEIQVFVGGSTFWLGTGLVANTTPNMDTPLVFDSETPVTNHLEFVGSGYGTANPSLSITLNGNTFTCSAAESPTGRISGLNIPPKYLTFSGLYSAADYLVDNVSLSGTSIPEPSDPQLTNGNFETVSEGTFDSWNYYTATSATVATTPLDESYSANIVAGKGMLFQQVSTGSTNFSWELDFAALPFSTGSRSLHIMTYETDPIWDPSAGNVDSIRVIPSGEIQFTNGSTWVNTGLIANITSDENTLLVFDGETPVTNHLEFVGKGYGTEEQSIEITLNGDTFTYSAVDSPSGRTSLLNTAPKYLGLMGLYSAADYLVDNVIFTDLGETPERIPGDANNDHKVDGSDVTILAGNWQAGVGSPDPSTITWVMGDFNGDGQIDGSDVTILAGNWQAGVTAAAASVPEPGTLPLLVAGLLGGLFMIRRQNAS